MADDNGVTVGIASKLPAPKEADFSKGILETTDMGSHRTEIQAQRSIALADQDAEIEPVLVGVGAGGGDVEFDRLSVILSAFNDQFGNIPWKDTDKIRKVLAQFVSPWMRVTCYQL